MVLTVRHDGDYRIWIETVKIHQECCICILNIFPGYHPYSIRIFLPYYGDPVADIPTGINFN
ncbi:MAG: hypothetical protein RBS55_13590, partial [Bacteroidales bacterium]|nr:hypothetical protein [Bacteroidales bacterium]